MRPFFATLRRELRLAQRQSSDILVALLFFVLAVLILPFGVGPAPDLLRAVAPGVIWVMALLAALLSMDRLFLIDHEDGSLEQIVLSPHPLESVVLAKCLAHWLTAGLPVVIVAPLLGLMLNMDTASLIPLVGALALGTPTLTLLGAIGAALVLGARRGGVLVSLLVLPLYIPVLIFGVAATDAAIHDLPVRPHLLIEAAILLAALALAPWACAGALRHAAE
ncbi:MAG: heme exporter protein CcmB [Proteobacteria bacterium]|nr:heme exporter protein CcmB [Pseudomonadota bacterium]